MSLALTLIPIAAVAVTASPARAEYPPPQGAVPPPGSIVVVRDVPFRPAFIPGEPGPVHTVGTAPVDLIFALTTGQTVSVLTDDETAGVAAGAEVQRGVLDGIFGGGNVTPDQQQLGTGPGQSPTGSLGGGFGGSLSNTIGTATGAINRALSPLSSIGGAK